MRKAHFGAIDGAISRCLEYGKDIVVFGVKYDALGDGLDMEFVFN